MLEHAKIKVHNLFPVAILEVSNANFFVARGQQYDESFTELIALNLATYVQTCMQAGVV